MGDDDVAQTEREAPPVHGAQARALLSQKNIPKKLLLRTLAQCEREAR